MISFMSSPIYTLTLLLACMYGHSQTVLSTGLLEVENEPIELTRDSIHKLMRYFQSNGKKYFQVECITYETTTLSKQQIIEIISTKDLAVIKENLGRFMIAVQTHTIDPDSINTISEIYYAIYPGSYGYASTWICLIIPKYSYSWYLLYNE